MRLVVVVLASLAASAHALRALRFGTHASPIAAGHRAPPIMARLSDSPDFLNNPIRYIVENPEQFDEDIQEMAAYQMRLTTDQMSLWGDLPEKLDECARAAASLRQKSQAATELAQIILKADKETLDALGSDATFQEKKHLFETLASLPADNRGMQAIDHTISQVIDWGPQGPQAAFSQDLVAVTNTVNEANEALRRLNQEYSTLFLSVRTIAQLTGSHMAAKKVHH